MEGIYCNPILLFSLKPRPKKDEESQRIGTSIPTYSKATAAAFTVGHLCSLLHLLSLLNRFWEADARMLLPPIGQEAHDVQLISQNFFLKQVS